MQLRIITVYGYHSSVPDSHALNELLFEQVFLHALAFNIPTMVAGDLNTDIYLFDSWLHAQERGFVDVGRWSAETIGSAPQFTYRGKSSRLDYLLLNEAAFCSLVSFDVNPRGYTDHAVLSANFSWSSWAPGMTWLMPADMAAIPGFLNSLQASRAVETTSHTSHGSFMDFCSRFEAHANAHHVQTFGTSLPAKLIRRGKGKLVKQTFTPLQLSTDGSTLAQRHTFRKRQQCMRWVRELVYEVERHSSNHAASHVFCASKGFGCSFPQWLLQNDVVDVVPLSVPQLEWLYHVANVH